MHAFKLYKTPEVILIEQSGRFFPVDQGWDALINHDQLFACLEQLTQNTSPWESALARQAIEKGGLPPIGQQEVWAAGVTYRRSRDARMEESQSGGGSDFYQKVYEAERPELFFKALPHRVSGPEGVVYIRRDSSWNVPEPELTLCINRKGSVVGYTIGNDMSSRSIEGENPLYLPQAKTYDGSAALGPCILVTEQPLPPHTAIRMTILRDGRDQFSGGITIDQIKRPFDELVSWLYRECSFPLGCYLMTGTGIVPPDGFTLAAGDRIEIEIDGIGMLRNTVSRRS